MTIVRVVAATAADASGEGAHWHAEGAIVRRRDFVPESPEGVPTIVRPGQILSEL
jgi:hypothetical protein